ncbi:MAG: zinc-dependent metalloprotease, partial [Bacteroidetes bacterium]|nr:zinc-dependent metalloprotease [Bacteroidota bacterium]
KDMIHRWNLEKKDKSAALSEPVEPITWWIENTTPVEFRSVIKDAALTWNLAFEKAGFKNAIKVEEQPDTSSWDAGDIRYNVLRWTSSPYPPFGGYGPSFVNPRTGEIIGADIMFEYVFITNRLKQENLFAKAGLNLEDEMNHFDATHCCQIGDVMQHNIMLGRTALTANGATEVEIKEYIKQSLYYLVLHEMGHTFGLNHNMRASTMLSPSQLNDKNVTDKLGLTASVMDYPAINLALDKSKQGLYFTNRPGPYDLWAIEYGYSESAENANDEEKRLQNILSRSTDTLLIFGNDADDMRGSASGIDPRVNIGDMSKDVIAYSADRIKLVNSLMQGVKVKYTKNGQSWQEMRQAYMILTGEMSSAATVVTRYVGGVYTDRAFIGQPGAIRPYTAVPLADQKKAMNLLAKNILAPDAFAISEDLASYLQVQRRGFNFFGNTEDPKIHDRVLAIQSNIISYLTSSSMLHRLTDSRLYGNKYTVTDELTDLTNAIFKEDIAGSVNTFRQNEQIYYVKRLIMILESSSYDEISKANAVAQLNSIKQMISGAPVAAAPSAGPNAETKAHRQYLAMLIKKAFEK